MTALQRPAQAQSTDMASGLQPAQVLHPQQEDGSIAIQCLGQQWQAVASTHLPRLVSGQNVLVAMPTPEPGQQDLVPLIVAAWPAAGAPACPPWEFDRASGALSLRVASLELEAVQSVLVHCADTRLQFTRDGQVQVRGQTITAAAVETHRIEGGSIELN
ncbi:MAG TPA: hypothetical protein DDZ62_12335 [Delftia acidovorans]|jgi:hypothetical protein|nr:hypothetical protein [Delftia acidovorans]